MFSSVSSKTWLVMWAFLEVWRQLMQALRRKICLTISFRVFFFFFDCSANILIMSWQAIRPGASEATWGKQRQEYPVQLRMTVTKRSGKFNFKEHLKGAGKRWQWEKAEYDEAVIGENNWGLSAVLFNPPLTCTYQSFSYKSQKLGLPKRCQ